jgi:hypothetical protein
MNIYIDTEFNEFRGSLISMALVAESGEEFYEVLPCENPGPWVEVNVLPILKKEPVSILEFQYKLRTYLAQFPAVHIVADWPEDIAHFCNALITGPGMRMNTPALTMEVDRSLEAVSALPHNALEDARAIAALAIERKNN